MTEACWYIINNKQQLSSVGIMWLHNITISEVENTDVQDIRPKGFITVSRTFVSVLCFQIVFTLYFTARWFWYLSVFTYLVKSKILWSLNQQVTFCTYQVNWNSHFVQYVDVWLFESVSECNRLIEHTEWVMMTLTEELNTIYSELLQFYRMYSS